MHDIFTVGVPLIAILAGILLNRSDTKELRSYIDGRFDKLRAELDAVRSEMRGRFDAVDAELRFFHGHTGKLEGRLDELSKNR